MNADHPSSRRENQSGEDGERVASAPETSPTLVFQSTEKTYRDFFLRANVRALAPLSLSVAAGEAVALLGPNGSGKSTAIKLAVGLLRPSGGKVRLFGGNPRDAATRRVLGYLPEENANYPFLRVREALTLHGRLSGLGANDAKTQARLLLERVELAAAAERFCHTLSKGMGRRLGLAQCLIGEPRLVILDEPASGLDPLGVELLRDTLETLKRRGVTILLASHLLAEIEDICDRVAILSEGKVVKQGTLEELLTLRGYYDVRFIAADANLPARAAAWVASQGGEQCVADTRRLSLAEFYRRLFSERKDA